MATNHANSSSSNSDSNYISVTILDSAQNKFDISIPANATVLQLKTLGHDVHSIPPEKQRLISMGQLLRDEKLITDHNIVHGSIVHLFPKPNVIITDSSNTSENNAESSSHGHSQDAENTNTGAHVPQIVMDSNEVNRQSSILILSTHEAYETMHRIRLLSFLLLMYSSIQMLRDVSIYLAPPTDNDENVIIPPGDPTDTSIPGQNQYEEQLPEWQNKDFFEMAICALGMYVALLGIKSTSEHIGMAIARRFVVLLGVLGVSWNLYLYISYVDELKARETSEDYKDGKVFSDAFFATALPLLLWLMFFLRAIQFYMLVKEAENDAEERTRSLASAIVSPTGNNGGDSDEESGGRNPGASGGGANYDLELQRSIT